MDLPTYTNIWRIEKRLYKLYDFRLPMPLPISWIAVFCGVTIPYVGLLAVIGVPFNHNLFFLYVLPPGVLTWLITRPVLENKRLPELLVSQLRYIGEPRTWCRLKPLSEKDGIRVYARVWHRAPTAAAEAAERSMALAQVARAAGERAPALPGRAGPGGIPGPDRAPGAGRKAWRNGLDRPSPTPLAQRPAQGPAAWPNAGLSAGQIRAGARGVQARGVQVRDGARAGAGPVRAGAEPAGPYRSGSGWARPGRPEPAAGFRRPARGPAAGDSGPGAARSGGGRCRAARPAPDNAARHRGVARDAGHAGSLGCPALGPALVPAFRPGCPRLPCRAWRPATARPAHGRPGRGCPPGRPAPSAPDVSPASAEDVRHLPPRTCAQPAPRT